MTSKREVESYLKQLEAKIKIFGILFHDDRGKNQQTLHDLEISPLKREEIIHKDLLKKRCMVYSQCGYLENNLMMLKYILR